ncbi:hypothetical protein QYF61_000795 [Mycteria americana]|uniref:Uncharacterized protein n=1 Tax=Mycteria americana TaxID=33587 RepID=A0AAN7S4Z1_MYCAM|nr:hypothetical protein QYF61_000795 [Mycteria americana]
MAHRSKQIRRDRTGPHEAQEIHGPLNCEGRNHRIIEWVGLEGTFTDHLIPTPLPWAGTSFTRPAPSNLALNTSRDGASTASLGNFFQCLITLIFKASTPCPITTCPCKKSLSSFLVGPLQVLEGCYKVSPEPSLLQAEQPQLSQPFFTGEVIQPSDHLCGPPLDSLQQVHVLLMLGAPEVNVVLQVGSHESGVEGENHLPRPAGHASFDAAQDTVGLLGCKRMLPGHVELLINQHPQVLLLRAALNPFSTQPVFVLGIAWTQVQDPALGLVEPHEVHTGSPLKPVKVPLDGIPSLQHVECATQLGVVSKPAEGALNPTVHVTDKDVKQCRQFLIHRVVHPSNPSLQFRDKDVMQDSVKHFAQVQSVATSPDCHDFSNMATKPSVGFVFVFEFVQELLVHPCRPPAIFA